ncbi:NADP-dependent oxidoreductase [Demequina rhizosphaerae]|uniref:NADP-dependent oxidoreductase n=1 Tax=Demequina rhizosphaerae TaxID=1638985 RepID=UPI0012E02D59|nr:NADP-dependent oxidoreductase [Demequina rhizosphaerae]
MTTQRAVLYDRTGGPEVLRLAEAPVPEPGAGEVVVDVRAVGLNPYDSKARAGLVPLDTPFPRSLGGDFAGVVRAVGAGARCWDGTALVPGDAVLGWGAGTLREHLEVPAAHVARKPDGVPFEVAGSLSTPGQTANAAMGVLDPGRDDVVLVSAAAGAVGFVYCQLAIAAGAAVVGTAGPANHARLRDIGVIPVEYGPGLVDRVREVAPAGITAVQDNFGREAVDAGLALGVAPDRICAIADRAAVAELGLRSPGRYERRADVLDRLARMVADGSLVLPVQQVFPLDRVGEAFALLDTRHLHGKVVVAP